MRPQVLRSMLARFPSATRTLSEASERPWVPLLVALAVAAAVWSAVAPASLPRLPGRPPAELPARLDGDFLDDLPTLVGNLPPDTAVEIDVPPQRRALSSWFWTMAAFTRPELVWQRAPADPRRRASWRLVPASDQRPDPGWQRVACGREWCLWRR